MAFNPKNYYIPVRTRAERQLEQAFMSHAEPAYWEIDEVALFDIAVSVDMPKACKPTEYLGLPIVATKGTAGEIKLCTVPRSIWLGWSRDLV